MGTGDPAGILGNGGAVTVSGFVEGDHTDQFGPVQISGVAGRGRELVRPGGGRLADRLRRPAPRGRRSSRPCATASARSPRTPVALGQVIGELFVHPAQASQQFSGPVGIAAAAGTSVQQGWVQYLSLIGVISLALGFFNVLPIPFLDGGRLLFILIEAVRRRRIDPIRQAIAIGVSLALIILLVVLITINDINHLSGGVH